MKEEVNIKVKNYKYFKSYFGDYDFKNVTKSYLSATFIINIEESDKIEAEDDAESAEWFNLNEIDFNEIKFESTKQKILDYIQHTLR